MIAEWMTIVDIKYNWARYGFDVWFIDGRTNSKRKIKRSTYEVYVGRQHPDSRYRRINTFKYSRRSYSLNDLKYFLIHRNFETRLVMSQGDCINYKEYIDFSKINVYHYNGINKEMICKDCNGYDFVIPVYREWKNE